MFDVNQNDIIIVADEFNQRKPNEGFDGTYGGSADLSDMLTGLPVLATIGIRGIRNTIKPPPTL
ncbi:hypothetical protein [Mesorhizobium sp. INR15]|uniref:hypothetical protein n=1 Tax=Mesorhizobium sp. INR15 TaxID=2654248 RepID=UPI00189699CF|nr:hypothetical protein [Mesorhizobium sp. INR15]QPC94839.1 hypothetical protein GA829_31975 [Mesorhizobium sp. INR15]